MASEEAKTTRMMTARSSLRYGTTLRSDIGCVGHSSPRAECGLTRHLHTKQQESSMQKYAKKGACLGERPTCNCQSGSTAGDTCCAVRGLKCATCGAVAPRCQETSRCGARGPTTQCARCSQLPSLLVSCSRPLHLWLWFSRRRFSRLQSAVRRPQSSRQPWHWPR